MVQTAPKHQAIANMVAATISNMRSPIQIAPFPNSRMTPAVRFPIPFARESKRRSSAGLSARSIALNTDRMPPLFWILVMLEDAARSSLTAPGLNTPWNCLRIAEASIGQASFAAPSSFEKSRFLASSTVSCESPLVRRGRPEKETFGGGIDVRPRFNARTSMASPAVRTRRVASLLLSLRALFAFFRTDAPASNAPVPGASIAIPNNDAPSVKQSYSSNEKLAALPVRVADVTEYKIIGCDSTEDAGHRVDLAVYETLREPGRIPPNRVSHGFNC